MRLNFSLDISKKQHLQKNDYAYFSYHTRVQYPALRRYSRVYIVKDTNDLYIKLNTGFWVKKWLLSDYPKVVKL